MFDNNSTQPLLSDVQYFVDQEFVVYHEFSGEGMQNVAINIYDACIGLYRAQHSWMAFIDVDEYLVIPSGRRISNILAPYQAYGGLVVNWR